MAHRSATVKINVEPYIARVVEAQMETILTGCQVCAYYHQRRGGTLLVAVAVAAERHGVRADLLLVRYLLSVHARHMAGLSLSTRQHTEVKKTGPNKGLITVQRACNGCQKSLGDANEAELDAAVDGRPLPDVRLECGCWTADVAA